MSDRIGNAVWGAIAGSTLGAPLTGSKSFARLSFYEPIPSRMTAAPSIDAWVVFTSVLEPTDSPSSAPRALFEHWACRDAESNFGRGNAARGLCAPATGAFANPLSNSSLALVRALFWALVFEGRPEEAARWAAFDASYDHKGDGVWIPSALARVVASVQPGDTIVKVIREFSGALPLESLGHAAIKRTLQALQAPDAVRAAVGQVRGEIPSQDVHDVVVSLTVILTALGTSKDAGSAMCAAASCGGASDQTAAVVGSLATLMWGPLDSSWMSPLGANYVASNHLKGVELPSTIDDLISKVDQFRLLFVGPSVEPAVIQEPVEPASGPVEEPVIETNEEPVTVAEELLDLPPPLPTLAGFPAVPLSGCWDLELLRVEVEYVDGPVVRNGGTWRLAVRFQNSSPIPIQVSTELVIPEGWAHSTKMSSFQLEGGAHAMHGIVFQVGEHHGDGFVVLKVNGHTIEIACLAPQKWFFAGPFANDDGTAFTKEAPPERALTRSAHFAGRSGLAVKWQESLQTGRVMDVEPLFGAGPGVVIAYSRFRFAKPGRYRLVAAGSSGVIVKVDGRIIVHYLDTHVPVPRDQDPYAGNFEGGEETTVVIRLIRTLDVAAPLTLYYLDETGALTEPIEYFDLPE